MLLCRLLLIHNSCIPDLILWIYHHDDDIIDYVLIGMGRSCSVISDINTHTYMLNNAGNETSVPQSTRMSKKYLSYIVLNFARDNCSFMLTDFAFDCDCSDE